MLTEQPAPSRTIKTQSHDCDLAVIGGGIAGVCCAITAARQGLKVTLIQDRPVLGGNASSEVRLWILGATAHMTNNNRWAREGGVLDEILTENLFRNREGNPIIVDTVLLEKVIEEPNIKLLLNTAAIEVDKHDKDTIKSVTAYCSQNETQYIINAPLFCDASGDGIVSFLAGAAFRMGAESQSEFDEKFAPSEEYGHLLGHSIYFYTQDTGKPVKFIAPSFAIKDAPSQIPRFNQFQTDQHGCRLWWIEYGGRLNTIHDTEEIKWELWKIVYGVWDHIKNSGLYPQAKTMTLQWVGLIPGKRESRRFEGPYILNQRDIIEQKQFPDAVAHGGWSIDLHPADGVYSERPGCDQYHSKGMYQIPYRCLYSRNINNLFLAGRIISASHVAFGSTRVMATCAAAAQAIAVAAAICKDQCKLPADLAKQPLITKLQQKLTRIGQFIPQIDTSDPDDLAQNATVTTSSTLSLTELPSSGKALTLENDSAQLLPAPPGPTPQITFFADVAKATDLTIELRSSSKPFNHSPDVLLDQKTLTLSPGNNQPVTFDFNVTLDQQQYLFYCMSKNPDVAVHQTDLRVTGLLTVQHWYDQKTDRDIGVEHFQFWRAMRRPNGLNFAFKSITPINLFTIDNLTRHPNRPTNQPNAFVADLSDRNPTITLTWPTEQQISRIELTFDNDLDHPMESVLWGQPEDVVPFCINAYRILDAENNIIHQRDENHLGQNIIILEKPINTDTLKLEILKKHPDCPASLFSLRCYK